jgi:hypothetical protein
MLKKIKNKFINKIFQNNFLLYLNMSGWIKITTIQRVKGACILIKKF